MSVLTQYDTAYSVTIFNIHSRLKMTQSGLLHKEITLQVCTFETQIQSETVFIKTPEITLHEVQLSFMQTAY